MKVLFLISILRKHLLLAENEIKRTLEMAWLLRGWNMKVVEIWRVGNRVSTRSGKTLKLFSCNGLKTTLSPY